MDYNKSPETIFKISRGGSGVARLTTTTTTAAPSWVTEHSSGTQDIGPAEEGSPPSKEPQTREKKVATASLEPWIVVAIVVTGLVVLVIGIGVVYNMAKRGRAGKDMDSEFGSGVSENEDEEEYEDVGDEEQEDHKLTTGFDNELNKQLSIE